MAQNSHSPSPNNGCSSKKVENDPWVPLETPQQSDEKTLDGTSPVNKILPLPQNPLYQMIDSEKYIQSLEQKLAKLKSKRKEPTSRDIINSLAVFHEDQMRRYIDDSASHCSSGTTNSSVVEDTSLQPSYLYRKLYPDRQPLNSEEVTELLKEDVVAERFEELTVEDDQTDQSHDPAAGKSTDTTALPSLPVSSSRSDQPATTDPQQTSNRGENAPANELVSEESSHVVDDSNTDENWANFDAMNEENGRGS